MRAIIANLPSGVSCAETTNGRGQKFWRVRLGKRFTGGKVIKRDFGSVKDAREWIHGDAEKERARVGSMVELKQSAGEFGFRLTPTQLNEAQNALKRCEDVGLTLTEAVDFAVRHAKPPSGSMLVAEAIECALREKEKSARPSYVSDLVKRWRRFERWLPADKRKALNAVTQSDIREFLNDCDLAPVGERNMLRNLSVLFTWGVKQGKMAANPCLGMETRVRAEKPPVRILSVAEAQQLAALVRDGVSITPASKREKHLDAWREQFGSVRVEVEPDELLPWFLFGCFGGLRPEELERLEWQHVDFKRHHVDLPAAITKDGERRIVDLPESVFAVLANFRSTKGKVTPPNLRRKRWILRFAMGWQEWPEDVLRHSFASYHLAKHRNAALTAELMGHKNARIIYAHYREVVKDAEDVSLFWSIPSTL